MFPPPSPPLKRVTDVEYRWTKINYATLESGRRAISSRVPESKRPMSDIYIVRTKALITSGPLILSIA
ncbi:hypothetical protein WH47_00282 [Habropoda laboriosa]|uniref:Uncharacterized protein n=1 Tax=Habropoda laboriosa TaxID=597456 RepID=A0A0L7R1Q8_9HYME|nr:hypothetical protein WH47_00282 [Habropoda laboriosa]